MSVRFKHFIYVNLIKDTFFSFFCHYYGDVCNDGSVFLHSFVN